MARLPKVRELYSLLVWLKSQIGDEYRASGCEDDPTPSMDVTIGWSDETGGWSYQTGDNSYTGGAYGFPHWSVVCLTRRTNALTMARDIRGDLADLAAS